MVPRTGTHFLANLLCLHPDCEAGAIAEDSLLTEAQLLSRYVRGMLGQWAQIDGEPRRELAELLQKSIGEGLVSFLYSAKKKNREERAKKFGQSVGDDR